MSVKQSIRKYPRLKTIAQAARGDQIIALNYPVDMKPRYDGGSHPELLRQFNHERDDYTHFLKSFLRFKEQYKHLPVQWVNGYFPALDGIALYSLLIQNNPATYLEIGSGYSTAFARHAIDGNNLRTSIHSIDPHPRAEIDHICDLVIRQRVEDVSIEVFDELHSRDILFVDNSHRMLPNSDVTVFFVDILPRLKPGVIVHLHDITLPWDYALSETRDAYTEQYPLASLLLMDARIKTILPNYYASRELPEHVEPLLSDLGDVEKHGVSFWFTIEVGTIHQRW